MFQFQVALYFIGIEGFELGDNPLIDGTNKHRLEDALGEVHDPLQGAFYHLFSVTFTFTFNPHISLSNLRFADITFTFLFHFCFRCFHPNVQLWHPLRAALPHRVLHRLLQLRRGLHHQAHERNHEKGKDCKFNSLVERANVSPMTKKYF